VVIPVVDLLAVISASLNHIHLLIVLPSDQIGVMAFATDVTCRAILLMTKPDQGVSS